MVSILLIDIESPLSGGGGRRPPNATLAPPSSVGSRTSNQINKQRAKHKTDYENLLLLQKIQSVKPSREIVHSLANLRVTN